MNAADASHSNLCFKEDFEEGLLLKWDRPEYQTWQDDNKIIKFISSKYRYVALPQFDPYN